MGHLGRAWKRMSHVDQWLQSRARMAGTLHRSLVDQCWHHRHDTLDDGLRRLILILVAFNSEGKVVPVQTRLRTTAKYAYTDNRLSGMTGYLALLELQANW
jgi:hypothetical protein